MTTTRRDVLGGLAATAAFAAARRPARAAAPLRLAFIDPLSGPYASLGEEALRHLDYFAQRIDPRLAARRRFEVAAFDNQLDAKQTLAQLDVAIAQGLRVVVHGRGAAVAAALVEAIAARNARRPDDPVLYLNYGAIDPALTGTGCSLWHFRFEADAHMKMAAITEWLRRRPEIGRVYVLGQDYSYGRTVAETAVRMLAKKRPDIEVVGRELHPLGIEDFAPYVERMRETGAEAVITGNWGSDLTFLLRAVGEADFTVPILTYYGGALGTQSAIARSAVGIVRQVSEFHGNVEGHDLDALIADFKAVTGYDLRLLRMGTMLDMLARAAALAGPAPAAIAGALEDLRIDTPTGPAVMRRDNHQLLQPLFVSVVSDEVRHDVYDTGLGFATELKLAADETRLPTPCTMRRPA